MLQETTLFGDVDKVETAIERLRAFAGSAVRNHPNGYVVCDSGGKDSTVIKELSLLAGVPFEVLHNHTTADHPETVYFVRREKARCEALGITYTISYPTYKGQPTSIWALIPYKCAPTRLHRWCCDIFKEHGGWGRFCVTGVRWSESVKRKARRATYEVPTRTGADRIRLNNDNDARRRLTELCMPKDKLVVNPIIDWSDEDVWEFIRSRDLPYNPLYDRGYSRVGCVGCPLSARKSQELASLPKFEQMYRRAFQQYVDRKLAKDGGCAWPDGDALFDWWISGKPMTRVDEDQLRLAWPDDEEGQDDAEG